MDKLEKGTIYIPDGMEQEGWRSHHVTQNGTQFKMYEFFISGIFYFIFLDHGWLQVTETAESETMDEQGLLYILSIKLHDV